MWKRKDDDAAIRTWQAAGVTAWESLKAEVKAEAESSERLIVPDADAEMGKQVVRFMRSDRYGEPVQHVWVEMMNDPKYARLGPPISGLRHSDALSPTQKRLVWRQTIIAAGLIAGTYDEMHAMHETLLREAEDLNLSPLDMSWTKELPGG